ncbi:MAG: ribonuclease Y [Puniceicoccaceae bacterium]
MNSINAPFLILVTILGGVVVFVLRWLQKRILVLENQINLKTENKEMPPPQALRSEATASLQQHTADDGVGLANGSGESGNQPQDPSQPEEDRFGTPLALTREEYRRRISALKTREASLLEQTEALSAERDRLTAALSKVSGLSADDAKEELRAELSKSIGSESIRRPFFVEQRNASQIDSEAKRTLLSAMQRMCVQAMNEHTLTQVEIPNEEMKGRLIGREGRNIRSFESETGTTLMIDESPGMVLISAFDPLRREIARQALVKLILDGRIHPANIEEAVQEANADVKKLTIALGEEAVSKLKLNNVHPEIVSLLGQLHFRHSNGQNTLSHSIEVAFFSSLLASEIGLDPVLAKRAGLFHDIGKAMSEEYEGSHAAAAGALLRRYGEPLEVVNAVEASHEEVEAFTPFVGLLMLADTLSAARPGARSDSTQGFIQRLRSLEDIAREIKGVSECYALQAGREIRVIVDPGKVSDEEARKISLKIRNQIEEQLHYPGTIRITVIREARFVEEAK